MIVLLTGGTGGAKFLQGLMQVFPQDQITCVVNTGDDLECWGLHVSPDVDSITYALAGKLSRERGWGVEGDTFECLEVMRRMGAPAWFRIGDRDLGLHLFRTEKLRAGNELSQVTADVAKWLGIQARILPMSDERVETRVTITESGGVEQTTEPTVGRQDLREFLDLVEHCAAHVGEEAAGTPAATLATELSFQEYFVRERYRVPVSGVRFAGAERARPAPGVIEAIHGAEAVILAPSNPVTSIGPILAVPGIRAALRLTPAPIAAVSPIVGGAAVSGPAVELMRTQDLAPSIAGVVRAYADFLDVLVADDRDAAAAPEVEAMGVRVRLAATIMKSEADKRTLAEVALESVRAAATAAQGG
ncbi:MAG: 2-phospho-L-lactate transferase [Acidobacteria bacterium]|nr:2-phospho-L-lactate transferase [Acidobacteriota bacterium]